LPRALSADERALVLAMLHEPRFVDLALAEVYAILLDEGQYLCSERTMYRLLAAHHEVRERRNQLRHPHYAAPELLARRPNELWSWDITKLLGPAKWTYFYLYVMLDVFSRYAVGWMLAHRESAMLSERFIHTTCARQAIGRDQLTIHTDRGPTMTSKPVALLLADLGITKPHARPHVSNDNPFSEVQFKTLKYRPAFPAWKSSAPQRVTTWKWTVEGAGKAQPPEDQASRSDLVEPSAPLGRGGASVPLLVCSSVVGVRRRGNEDFQSRVQV
jgi:putative transposase